jgi:hypothetical protein
MELMIAPIELDAGGGCAGVVGGGGGGGGGGGEVKGGGGGRLLAATLFIIPRTLAVSLWACPTFVGVTVITVESVKSPPAADWKVSSSMVLQL